MPDFLDEQSLFRIGRRKALLLQPNLAVDAVDREGSGANTLLAAAALMGGEISGQLTEAYAGLWLNSARRERLDKLIWDRYQKTRKPASVAYGSVQFSTASPAVAAFTIPSGLIIASTDGRQYSTVETVEYPLGSVGPITVRFVSTLTGLAQQARPGTITRIVGTIAGAPSDLAMTNVTATAGADDEEQDDAFVARVQALRSVPAPGTAAGLEARALEHPGVTSARAYEGVNAYGLPARTNLLVITDRYTADLATLSDPIPTYAAQSSALAASVLATLDNVRALGIETQVVVAQTRLLPGQLALSLLASATPDTVLQARNRFVGYVNQRGAGGRFQYAAATRAIAGVPGLNVTGKEIVYPPSDVVVNPLEVVRTDLSLVTVSNYTP